MFLITDDICVFFYAKGPFLHIYTPNFVLRLLVDQCIIPFSGRFHVRLLLSDFPAFFAFSDRVNGMVWFGSVDLCGHGWIRSGSVDVR